MPTLPRFQAVGSVTSMAWTNTIYTPSGVCFFFNNIGSERLLCFFLFFFITWRVPRWLHRQRGGLELFAPKMTWNWVGCTWMRPI